MQEHIDLFTGLAGFSLAAQANEVKTIAQCESDPFLRAGLARAWGVPIIPDVRQFKGRAYRRVWLVTAGVPCQPASRAGDQRGAQDDRWLWPETLRIVKEAGPTWGLFENPPGLNEVGIDGIIAELESLKYEVWPLRIPACALNSPQDRDRFWILARSTAGRRRREPGEQARRRARQTESITANQDPLANRPAEGHQERALLAEHTGDGRQTAERTFEAGALADCQGEPQRAGLRPGWAPGEIGGRLGDVLGAWKKATWLPVPTRSGKFEIRRAPIGLYELAYGLPSRLPRGVGTRLIAALGNAIVWPLAAEIIAAMKEADAQPPN